MESPLQTHKRLSEFVFSLLPLLSSRLRSPPTPLRQTSPKCPVSVRIGCNTPADTSANLKMKQETKWT
ncbi:hypothetical protein E2C01_024704 [Portunus trituberculatus]|uniref:Uncharacterized protein n=1 Tax=Portunus trituberculatus TaxID=210409 RepID=A0A5B7EDG9_PORTR|nr:hypothetical protein [Portunus trituberculatus]